MKTKPFNLEEALKGAKVVTRDGREVLEIYCFSSPELGFPVYALVDRQVISYTKEGKVFTSEKSSSDLFLLVEPKLRPWKPEEVPVGALIRQKSKPQNRTLITAMVDGAAYLGRNGCSLGDGHWKASDCEYSIDQGKTWLACGVEE